MSIECMNRVWKHSQHKGSNLLMLLAIADYASDDGTHAFPSVSTLATKTRMSERSVQRILRKLEDSGELHTDENGGPNGTNMYTVTVWPDNGGGGRQDDGGDARDAKGATHVSPKPLVNHQLTNGHSPDDVGERYATLLAQPTLTLDEVKELLAAHAEGITVNHKKINCGGVIGKLFKKRFDADPNYGRLAGLAKFARKQRDGDTTETRDWLKLAQIIQIAGEPHGDIYDYLVGMLRERPEHVDVDEDKPTYRWVLRQQYGEPCHIEQHPSSDSVERTNSEGVVWRVSYANGEPAKAWQKQVKRNGKWVPAQKEKQIA